MVKFDEYIVAYIDILGTSEKIKNDVDNSHFEMIKSIYEETNKYIKYNNKLHENNEWFSQVGFKIFSDNIIVFAKVNTGFPLEAEGVFFWIHSFQANALTKGLLTRGGITQGEFYYNENFVYGKALLEAVKLEENCAIYPRVIFSPKIEKYRPSFVSLDADGLHFINYMHLLCILAFKDKDSAGNECSQTKLLAVKQLLISLYSKEVNGNTKILQKYQWLINQYNLYCKGIECGEIQEKLEQNMSFEGVYIKPEELSAIKV